MNGESLEKDYLQLNAIPMNRGVVHGHIHNYNNLTYIHGHIHKNDSEGLAADGGPDSLSCSQFQDCEHFEFVNCHNLNLFESGKNGKELEGLASIQNGQDCNELHCHPKLLEVCCDKDHESLPSSIATGLEFLDCHLTCDTPGLEEESAEEDAEELVAKRLLQDSQIGIKAESSPKMGGSDSDKQVDQVLTKVDPSKLEIKTEKNVTDDQFFEKLCSQSVNDDPADLSRIQHFSHSHILNTPNDMKVLKDLSSISNLYDFMRKPDNGVDMQPDSNQNHDSMNLLHTTLSGNEIKCSDNCNHHHHHHHHHHHQVQLHNHSVLEDTGQQTIPNTINFNWSFNTNNDPIQCEWNDCSHSFDNLLDLQSHLMKNHVTYNDQKSFDCQWNDCNFNTTDFGSIVNHVNNQHGIGFDAKIIDDAVIAKQVEEHKIPHEDPPQHVCKWNGCNQVFASSKELNDHMEKEHIPSGLSSYTCEWDGCGKTFVQKQKLIRHLKVHSKYKPFKCPECGKCFNTQDILTQHLRIHSGEKPFKCHLCPKSYSTSSSLRVHIRTHTGEKPLSCPICHRRFNESSNLAKHIKIHQRDKK